MSKLSFFTCLVLLSMIEGALGQAAPRNPLPAEPLEKLEDPPAYIWRTDVSPGMVSRFDGFTSHQVNVNANGQNISGDAANEPSICLDPNDSNKMSIGWRQFNSVASNFRQGGFAYTTNGGTSWTFPGNLQNNVFRSDPVLLSDATGAFFYLSLIAGFQCDIWRSATGGQAWSRLAPAVGGDKQWFTIDNTNSTGRGFQYQSWSTGGNNYGGRQFSRSTNGGFTWMDPIFIPNAPSLGTLDVDADGNVFIGGFNMSTGAIWSVRSSNAKDGSVTPVFDQSTPVNLGGDILGFAGLNPEGLLGQVFLVADRSGTATNNNVYVLASVRPFTGGNGTDVMFVRSTNRGQSFSAPLRINDDPVNPNKWHWFGTLAVAPNGRIDVVWLDTRNAANNTDSQLFYSYSANGGVTWSPNVAVSAPFNPFLGYPNQNKMGDYMTIVSDNRAGHVAYCATFNGEQDIYYVRVAPAAPVAQSAVSRKTHTAALFDVPSHFDVPLPLTGNVGIECRQGSGINRDNHQMVVSFATPVTVAGATVTSSDGLATATRSVSGGVVTVNLASVTNGQTITVTLTDVSDGIGTGDVSIPMGVLLADTNSDRLVNAGDALQTRSRSGQPADAINFRSDVNTDGFINSGDTLSVRSRSGTSLP